MKKILATILAAALGLGAWGAPGITDGVTDNPAAAIGSTGYATLADAIAAVNPGDTVTLMQDVTLDATLELTKSMTLDLNGKTLSKTLANTTDTTPVIKALSGTVEIKNGSITYDHSTFTGTGAVSKPSVLFVGMNMSNGVYSYGDCNLTLNGVNVSVTFPSGKASMTMVYVESGRLNIVDSNLSATTGASNTKTQYMIYTTAHASAVVDPYVSISGTTTIDTNEKPGIHAIWLQGTKDTLIISGDDVTINADAEWKAYSWSSTMSYAYAVNVQSAGATCTIEGGNFTGKVWANNGTITVSGGHFSYAQGTSGQKNKFTLAEGVEYVENTDPATKDEYPYLVGAPASYVAQVISIDGATTNKYENLMEAINAAYNGGTVELLADVTVDHWHQNIWTLVDGEGVWDTSPRVREPTAGPNGLAINGNGHSLTINGVDSGSNGNHIFAGSRNLTVSNITINAASGVNGIGLKSGTISDVTFNMAGSNPAIYTSGSAGCEEGEHIEIRNCTFNTSASDSYGIYSCDPENGVDSGTIISGNTFNTRRSVALRSDMQFLNNTVNGAKGVTVARGSTAVVRGNYFADTTTSRSINVYPSNATIENNVILGPIELEDETYAVAPDLSNNYWGGNAPANLPEGVVVNSYYTTYSGYASPAQDGSLFALSDPVETYVAQIGETKYATLAEAFAAANEAGTATITMIADSVETAGSTLAAGKSVVLDLNGKAVSYESDFPAAFNLITVNGTLTVTDTSDGSNGSIALTSTANLSWDYAVNMFLVGNGGSLTIEKGSYSVTTPSYGYAEYVIAASNNSGASTVVINGGTFTGNNIDAVVRLHDQYGRNQPLNVTVNGGDFTLNGSQCDSVIWFDVQKSGNGTDNASVANLVINGGTFTSTSTSPALDLGHDVDASGLRVTVAGGAFKSNGAVIKTRKLSAAAIANIQLSGGIYSGNEYYNDLTKTTDKLDALCVAGCKVAANADAETSGNYPYVVGLLKVTDIVQQAGATETSATYAVTVVVVNDKGETIGTLPDLLTIEVSIAAADVAGSTLAKYDVSKVLDAALASGGLNVTKVEISVVISAPSSGEGTVSYEVHPEAVVTVTKDATDTTTTIPLSNACLAADASFTFDLDATGVVVAGNWAKVTHVSADSNYAAEARNLKAFAGDGGKVYVTVTTTHFSTFTIGSGVPPVTFDVRSDNLFGSIKIEGNVASNLYVATLFEGFEADGALRKAQDVVHATNLTAGTKMYVYDKNADKYDVFEVDANGKWAAALKINVTEMTNTFDTADLMRGVTNGTGVIVGRKNTAETVYVYGQVPKIPIASTTFGAGQTLVSPPYTNGVAYVDLNASKWTGVKATQLKRLKNQKGADYIQFRTADNRLVKYFYLEGEGWGVVPTQVSLFSQFVANGKALIPVGTAFWYYSTSGGAKVEWK